MNMMYVYAMNIAFFKLHCFCINSILFRSCSGMHCW